MADLEVGAPKALLSQAHGLIATQRTGLAYASKTARQHVALESAGPLQCDEEVYPENSVATRILALLQNQSSLRRTSPAETGFDSIYESAVRKCSRLRMKRSK